MVSLERAKRLLKSKETQKGYEMLKTPVAKFTPVEALKPEAVIAPDVSNMTAMEALQSESPRPQAGYVPQTAQKAAFDRGINEFKEGVVDKARIFGENLMAGIGQWNKAFYNALESIGGDKIPGVKNVLKFGKEVAERDISKGGTDIGSQLIQAVPNAVTSLGLAAMTGGASIAPQLGKTALQQSAQAMLKNPMFYNALIRSYGGAYGEAREAGQDRGAAISSALLQAVPTAVIEQAGGIEQLPAEAAKRGLLKTIGKTALEEAGEELLQYPFGGAVKKATYAPETPVYSTTEEAVINPAEMGKGAFIGGVMGGLMGGVGKVMTGDVRIKPVQKTYIDYQAETPRSPAIYGEPIQQTQQRLFAGDTQQEAQPMLYTGDTQQETRPIGEPEIPDGTRERGVSANIRTDANSPEGLRASLEQEPLTYTQKSNIETLSRAEQIMSEGYETARAKLDEMLDNMDTEAAPLAIMLAREAWTRGDKQGSRQIIAHAAEKATQAGQFGQAFRILRDSDPASLLTSMQNQIKKLNKDGRKQYGKKWTDVELTDEEISLIMNTPLETEAELKELQKIIGQRIANELPSTGMEMFNAWRRIAMLFNPKTHIRNVGGNILMSGMQRTADIVGAGLEKIFLPKDQRTKAIAWKSNKDLVRKVNESWNANKDMLTHESRYDIASLKALGFDKRIFKSGILQGLNDITMQGLNLGDIPFVQTAYKNSLGQFMKARGLAEVTPEAELYATRRAFEATFKETNEMASILNRLKQKPVVGTLVEGAIPFTKTPANITMRAIDYSPGGLLKALYDVKAGKTAAQVIEDVSKGLTGTALMALGVWLSKIGWARVERDRSEKAEGLYQEMGRQSNSIITPKGSYTFDWAQPFAVPLAIGVTVGETMSKREDGDSLTSALIEGLYAGGDTIFNMTMLRNIKDIFGSGGSPTKKVLSIPVSYIEQAIPAIFGQAARTIDPVRRSTYDPDPMRQEWNRIKSRIPFASKTLEPMLNVWGEEQRQGGILEQFISPGYFATPTDNHVTLEVARLYDAFKDTDMLPKVAPAKFSADKVDYVLSAEQRTQFQQDMGQANYNDLARFISSAEYQRLTDAQKVKRIKGIINDNYNDMKDAIIKASALKGN